MKLIVFLYIAFIIFMIVLLNAVTYKHNINVDMQTKITCQEMAIKNKYDYRNTEFKNFDFYKSCIDNVRYTSPLNR